VRIRSREVPKVVAVEVSDSVQEPAAEAVRIGTADPPIDGGVILTVTALSTTTSNVMLSGDKQSSRNFVRDLFNLGI
jgi:hypothetical protein